MANVFGENQFSIWSVINIFTNSIEMDEKQELIDLTIKWQYDTCRNEFNSFTAKFKNVIWDYFHVQYYTTF